MHLHGRKLLSCMHQPIQPKSISWWEEVGNSLILQQKLSLLEMLYLKAIFTVINILMRKVDAIR